MDKLWLKYCDQFAAQTYTDLESDEFIPERMQWILDNTPWHKQLALYLESKAKAELEVLTRLQHVRIADGKSSNELIVSELEKWIDTKDRSSRFYFITVNPPPEVDPEKFFSVIHSIVTAKVLKWALYSFEQRSEKEGEYTGIHSHLVVCRNKAPSAMRQAIKRSLASIMNVENGALLNFKEIPIDAVEQKRDYITGQKKDEKLGKVENDKNFREAFGLNELYTTNACPSLLVGTPP